MSIPVLPNSAPFSIEQRAWLNGFFAAVFNDDNSAANANSSTRNVEWSADEHSLNRVGSDSGGNDSIAASPFSLAAMNGVAPANEEAHGDEEMPWHDAALSLDERMEMAKEKPLKLKMMAAMAQLDCGQCGYLCRSYAEAIVDGSEKSLRKCVPGEKPTANKLKELLAA